MAPRQGAGADAPRGFAGRAHHGALQHPDARFEMRRRGLDALHEYSRRRIDVDAHALQIDAAIGGVHGVKHRGPVDAVLAQGLKPVFLVVELSGSAALASAIVVSQSLPVFLSTPFAGHLVDRLDRGSHPDLSYHAMRRSVELLPLYFDELVALRGGADGPDALGACIAAGRRAEARMRRSAGSNAHRFTPA